MMMVGEIIMWTAASKRLLRQSSNTYFCMNIMCLLNNIHTCRYVFRIVPSTVLARFRRAHLDPRRRASPLWVKCGCQPPCPPHTQQSLPPIVLSLRGVPVDHKKKRDRLFCPRQSRSTPISVVVGSGKQIDSQVHFTGPPAPYYRAWTLSRAILFSVARDNDSVNRLATSAIEQTHDKELQDRP